MRLARTLPLLAALCGALAAPAAVAAPVLRKQIELRGDLLLFGNTVGFDCRQEVPRPIVGNVDIAGCGVETSDSEIDVLWRADDPGPGQAIASPAITPGQARTTAVLQLPQGAVVTYARLYWAASQGAGAAPGMAVLFERPGMFNAMIQADSSAKVDSAASSFYQSGADVTEILQDLGPGPYRVGAIPARSPVGRGSELNFVAWSVVVFYKRAADPPRNLTLFDGLDRVDDTRSAAATLERFLVPQSGFDAKLGVLAYEGDRDAGDRIKLNGMDLSDAQNPPDNFLNGTRSVLGEPRTVAGDLPQLSGGPNSMNGIDMDVVDVTRFVRAGDKSASIAASTAEDVFFLGALIGSVGTLKPIFIDTDLIYINLSNPGGAVRPGDRLEGILTTRNTGSDASADTVAQVRLPPELRYVPGSIRVASGPNAGPKSDGPGDDQAEFDMPSRAIKARLGRGAGPQDGGSIAPEESTQVRFQVTVDPMAPQNRPVYTQGEISAAGVTGKAQGIPPMTWTSGNGVFPSRRTPITPKECERDRDCPRRAPRCEMKMGAAPACTNNCQTNADCAMAPTGKLCLPTMPASTCGCVMDSDCPSNMCDRARSLCVIPEADIEVSVRLEPEPPSAGLPVTHIISVRNRGPGTAPSVEVTYTIPEGGKVTSIDAGPGWTCTQTERTVRCTRQEPLPPGAAPDIRITVEPPPQAKAVDVNVVAGSPFVNDPDPANNTVTRSVDISPDLVQISGGGASCAVSPRSHRDAAGLSILTVLGLCLLGARRRRRN